MASRMFSQFRYSLEKAVVDLYGEVAIGSTGAPTMSASHSKGISGITRSSAGKYVIALQDKYQRLLDASWAVKAATGAPSATSNVQPMIRAESANSITVEFVDATGAAVELASGVTLKFRLGLKNSTV